MSDIRVRVGQNNTVKVLSSVSGSAGGRAVVSENVIGGIASVTQLNVTGVTTFSENVYIAGNLGVGTLPSSSPSTNLIVGGDVRVLGVLTAKLLYSDVYGEFTGGSITARNIVGTALSISGISTFSNGPVLIGGILGFNNSNVKIGDLFTGANTIPDPLNPDPDFNTNNIFIGNNAGYLNNPGHKNIFVGYYAGYGNTTGSNNNFFGTNAGYYNTSGSFNTFLGSYVGLSSSASNKIIIGQGYDYTYQFDSPNTTSNTQFAIGIRTDVNASKYWLVGNENFNVGIGTVNPTSKLSVGGDILVAGIVTATGGFNIGIQSGGINITTGPITTLNFIGAGNTFKYNSQTKTIDISIVGGAGTGGGGGGGGGLPDNIVGTALSISGISTLSTLIVENEFYYVPSNENGIAYFDSSGLMVSTGATSSSIDYTNYILTTDNSGIPTWTNVIDGGSY